jgi:ribosomal protein L37AE/L43A
MCADGEVVRGVGRLEQSGDTYLATTIWACRLCGFVRYEPALGERWRAAEVRAEELDHPKRAA